MQIATSMMGKHYKNASKKLTIPMKQIIAFSLYTDIKHSFFLPEE